MNLSHTIQLSISSPNLDSKCLEVIALLKKQKIANVSVEPNSSIQCRNGKCRVENGCRITLGTKDINCFQEKVWRPLQNTFSLGCAHLKVEGYYSGCVYDFWRESNCPGN